MRESSVTLDIAGEEVRLLPERAALWVRRRHLIVADLHWGKVETFQTHGIPLPSGLWEEEASRLEGLARRWDALRIVIVGDLVHAPAGLTAALLDRVRSWLQALPCPISLVAGNHDRGVVRRLGSWPLEIHRDILVDAPFAFVHEPSPSPGRYAWSGHLHPTIRLGNQADRLRLPCFVIGTKVAVLPAFSSFTNGPPISRSSGERIFAIAEDALIEV
jgi:DNA ligase-associated metallophosphoesterase